MFFSFLEPSLVRRHLDGQAVGAGEALRTKLQDRPVGDATWGKEAQLLNQLYRWLVEYGHLRHRPLRLTGKGRNPLTPRLRRGMDIRHMTARTRHRAQPSTTLGHVPGPGVREVRQIPRDLRAIRGRWTPSRTSCCWNAFIGDHQRQFPPVSEQPVHNARSAAALLRRAARPRNPSLTSELDS